MVVVDASVVVAALIDSGSTGRWAEQQLASQPLAAPHLCPVEAANLLRRSELAGGIDRSRAASAHQDLLRLPWQLYPYEPFGARVWELRPNVTAYDAWYVAVAELLGAPVATLDRRLVGATGPRCAFVIPPMPVGA
ncbi:MAG: type II toxin-antitoxin system VapC family toxin [Egibacteraceae bacterium]